MFAVGAEVDVYIEHAGKWRQGVVERPRSSITGLYYDITLVGPYLGSVLVPEHYVTPRLHDKGSVPPSKREAAEVHAAAGIGPTAPLNEAAKRKAQPIARGVLDYFPDALLVVAEVSRIGNDQHNPGQPLHWAFGKSMDHADCIMRHMIDRGSADTDEVDHAGKVAWRALAMLQTALEQKDPELHARREAQRKLAAEGKR